MFPLTFMNCRYLNRYLKRENVYSTAIYTNLSANNLQIIGIWLKGYINLIDLKGPIE